jgi:multidrug efflux pump subunit AcrA (membrane-fusion protein)
MTTPLPALRSDLEWLARAAPGRPDRVLLKDPVRGSVLDLSEKEAFVCRGLDGVTDAGALRAAFQERFGLALSAAGLEALLALLAAEGLLAGSRVAALREWETMRPLKLDADRLFRRLARWVRPLTGWPLVLVFAISAALALGVLAGIWPAVWEVLAHFLWHIRMAGALGFSSVMSVQTLVQVAVFFTLIPLFRELAKGTAAAHYGVRVPEVRFGWFCRFIPRCIAGIQGIFRLEKKQQARVVLAGLGVEALALCLGLIGVGIFGAGGPVGTLFSGLSIGAALRLFFTANPLGEQDGSVLAGIVLDEPDLRYRSVRLFRAWLTGRPPPEPMPSARRWKLIAWGAASDLAVNGITIVFLWVLGYLLVHWMGGVGAVVALALVLLTYEKSLRSLWADRGAGVTMAKVETSGKKRWLRNLLIAAVVLVLLCVVPYPYEISGEFRVQPVAQREVRSEIAALIKEIPVSEGDAVVAGDVIARLDTRLLEKDLELNQAALRKEREHLRAMETGARPEDIAQLEQAVRAAETKLRYSEETLVRTVDLHEKGHVAEQEYQNVLQVRDLDRENLELARLALVSLQAGVREEEIAAQRAVVESLEITLKHQQDDLTRAILVSPIDGRVVSMYLQGRIGSQTSPGDVIAVVEDLSTVTVRIALPEVHLGLVTTGATVRVRPWAYPRRVFPATVTAIIPQVMDKSEDLIKKASVEQERNMMRNASAPEERIVPVLATVDDAEGLFTSDMTGFAKIDAGWKPVGYAFLHPVLRFFTVQVWSWIP